MARLKIGDGIQFEAQLPKPIMEILPKIEKAPEIDYDELIAKAAAKIKIEAPKEQDLSHLVSKEFVNDMLDDLVKTEEKIENFNKDITNIQQELINLRDLASESLIYTEDTKSATLTTMEKMGLAIEDKYDQEIQDLKTIIKKQNYFIIGSILLTILLHFI